MMNDHEVNPVLILDDEPDVCELVGDVLEQAGYSCESAATGAEMFAA